MTVGYVLLREECGGHIKLEMGMTNCIFCGSIEFRADLVSEMYEIDGHRVLIENIPVQICVQCGEMFFSRETSEYVRLRARGETQQLDVLQQVDALLARLAEQNAGYDEEEVAADVEAAIQEMRSSVDE